MKTIWFISRKKPTNSRNGTPGTLKSMKTDNMQQGHVPKILGRAFCQNKSPSGNTTGHSKVLETFSGSYPTTWIILSNHLDHLIPVCSIRVCFHLDHLIRQIQWTSSPDSYLRLSLDDRVCTMSAISGFPWTINIFLHKWTPQAMHPSRHHIELHLSFWTSRNMSLDKSGKHTFRSRRQKGVFGGLKQRHAPEVQNEKSS